MKPLHDRRVVSAVDGGLQIDDGPEDATPESLAGEFGEEAFNGVERFRRDEALWDLGTGLAKIRLEIPGRSQSQARRLMNNSGDGCKLALQFGEI